MAEGHGVGSMLRDRRSLPFNQGWPGYQRPVDQTELAAFAYCDAAGPVSVQITARRQIKSVVVRPSSRNITPAVKGQLISFEVAGPGQFTVEVNGWHHALHLFVNPPEHAAPSATEANIALDIQHGDRATVHDIRFENIRVEGDDFTLRPGFQQTPEGKYTINPQDDYRPRLLNIIISPNSYSLDKQAGVVRNIVFRDITVTSKRFLPSCFRGLDAQHDIVGVTIDNLCVNGRRCAGAGEAQLEIQPHVSDVTFVAQPGR